MSNKAKAAFLQLNNWEKSNLSDRYIEEITLKSILEDYKNSNRKPLDIKKLKKELRYYVLEQHSNNKVDIDIFDKNLSRRKQISKLLKALDLKGEWVGKLGFESDLFEEKKNLRNEYDKIWDLFVRKQEITKPAEIGDKNFIDPNLFIEPKEGEKGYGKIKLNLVEIAERLDELKTKINPQYILENPNKHVEAKMESLIKQAEIKDTGAHNVVPLEKVSFSKEEIIEKLKKKLFSTDLESLGFTSSFKSVVFDMEKDYIDNFQIENDSIAEKLNNKIEAKSMNMAIENISGFKQKNKEKPLNER